MSDAILDGVKVVAGPVKSFTVDRIIEYVKFIKSHDDNMTDLLRELKLLCSKKQDIDAKVLEGKERLHVMTRETANWVNNFNELIESEEMRKLMKKEKVAEIVVRIIERRVLKKLWKENREVFDIVVNVVKKKCNQEAGDEEVVDAEEDVDYKKVAKIASDVIKDIAEEFKKFIKTDDDAAIGVVKLLNDVDLEKLREDGDEMAMILSKAEGIIRKEAEHNEYDHGEEELQLPKHEEDAQSANNGIIKEKVGIWRKHIGSLMTFLNDENFKKELPDEAKLGMELMDALSKDTKSEHVKENTKPHRYCGCCVDRFKFYRDRHDMSANAEIMVKAIKSRIAECPSGLVTRPKRADELETIPGDFMKGLESREELLQKILIALQDDKVKVVGVFGMGGAGKTTLAKEVAYKRTSGLFDKRVVVEVSEAPNIVGIQDQIAEGINLPLDDVHTQGERARKIYNALKSEKRKILIIVDNLWKKLKLDEVGIPCGSTKDFCCKLLITTRERQVCRVMDVQDANIFEVGMLNEREALNLFENQIGKTVDNEEFKPVVDRLLRKCAGLPLAIVTTASTLRDKNVAMWCQFAEISEKHISSQVDSEYREIYSILETSYKLMDIEEKKLFLFCVCLSPVDSAIKVEDLMKYGIGLDLFQRVNNLSEAIEQTNTWVSELISSSLLLKGDSDGQVKIHDVVRASFISFIDKGKNGMTLVENIPRWMCKTTFEKFTAISLMSGHDFSRLSGVKAPMLEILLLNGNVSSTTLSSDFFKGMTNLKVLNLTNIDFKLGLPKSMTQLKRLSTLHLHQCNLKEIKLISKLVNLLVLSLRGSSLEELPVEIGELYNLRLLDMGGCKGMKRIPANILSRLSHLEGLYMLNGFDGWASSTNTNNGWSKGMKRIIANTLSRLPHLEVNDGEGSNQVSGSELDTLSHLNVLEMEVSNVEQLLTVNNGQLVEQLGKFKIRVRNSNHSYEEVPVFRYVLELIDIHASPSNWLTALVKKTECLVLRHFDRLVKNLVPQLDKDGFKDLKYLVAKFGELEFIISSNEQDESLAFANLEYLWLEDMNKLTMICDGKAPTGIFSNLRSLTLEDLLLLDYGLPLTSVALNLTEISIKKCTSLGFIVYKDAAEINVEPFPHLKSLHMSHVKFLSSMLGQSNNEVFSTFTDFSFFNLESKYPSLESLELSFNEMIGTIWSQACYVSSFQNLKVIHIEMCKKLRSLGSPSIFAGLIKLEELKISSCRRLQEVISEEMGADEVLEHVINFPSLKRLSLHSLTILKRFYGGSYKLQFPNLQSLSLSSARNLTNFDGSENPITFFSDKIEFPALEELEVRSVSRQVVRLWNWSSSGVEGQTEINSNSLNPVPNLQKLTLGQVPGLTSIPHQISHKLSHLQVSDFRDIKSLFSASAVDREVFWAYSQLPNLETLCVSGCDSLEQLFVNEDDDGVVMLCERLTGITLDTMPKLKIFPLHLLKNICTLSIRGLSWEYLFPGALFIKGREQLQQLEKLEIGECENMEVIIKDELVGDGDERVYGFPRLKILELNELKITKFASKPNTGLHFPLLESMELKVCRKIETFCSGPFTAPKLKNLKIYNCCNMEYFLSENTNEVGELASLERLYINCCLGMLSFALKPLVVPQLNYVMLAYCKMKWLLRGDPAQDDVLELPSLERVAILESDDIESFSSGRIKAPNLCKLSVNYKEYFKYSNEEQQDLLVNLSKCQIRDENSKEGYGGLKRLLNVFSQV